MRRASKSIRRGSNDSRRQIEFFENSGTIICVGSDKAYDGLNPHHVNLDELHAWNEYHRDFYDTMMTGSGYRDQPLISIITTAGDDKSHLWKEVYSYASDVVSGVVNDESYFAFIAELDKDDDPLDEDNWEKANPNLGVSVSLDYLRQQAIEAKQSSVNLNRFTRYHGNRMVSSIEKAFDLEKWDERGVDELSDWSEADAYGIGVDLGARDDLAARAIVARFLVEYDADTPVYRYEAKVQAYIADDCKRDLTKQPFAEWVYGGRLIKSRVPITDLTEDVVEQAVEYNAHAVAYDPYNGQAFAEALEAQGITVARCAQNCSMFNEPIQDLLQAISHGRFTHDRNPLLRWAVNNAVITKDRQGRMMYDKSKSSEKIDPTVAMTMAFRIASLAPQRATGSLYI